MQELVYRIANEIDTLTMGEKFLGGLLVTAFSIFMVFAVLILLMYIIKGLGLVLGNKAPKAAAAKEEPIKEEVMNLTEDDENEVMAAIIGAISSMNTGQDSKIVIRQVVRNNSNWANSGLLEQINSRI